MLFPRIRPHISRAIENTASILYRNSLGPDQVSLFALIISLFSLYLIGNGYFLAALLCILASRFLDSVSNALSHKTDPIDPFNPDAGVRYAALLAFICNLVLYAGIPLAFAAYDHIEYALPACFMLFGVMIAVTIHLVLICLTAENVKDAASRINRPFYTITSRLNGTGVTALLVLICLFPTFFDMFAYLFGTICLTSAALSFLKMRKRLD